MIHAHPIPAASFAGRYNRRALNDELLAGSYSVEMRGHRPTSGGDYEAVFGSEPSAADRAAVDAIAAAHGDTVTPLPSDAAPAPVYYSASGGGFVVQEPDGTVRSLMVKP